MNCPVPPPIPMLAVGKGAWSFALAFVDAAGNPIDLTAAGLTPVASFFQGNTGATTALAVDLVDAPNGLAAAIVPEAVVLSTLYPAPSARLLGGLLSVAPTPNFRLYAYVLDSLGARTAESIIAVQPVDWRSADPGVLPQPPLSYIAVGPSGPATPGPKGDKGDPGGVAPHTGTAAASITLWQVVRAVTQGVAPASAADPAQAGTVVGIATEAATGNAAVTYVDAGSLADPSWSWSPGPIFFDGNGHLTQTAPTTGFVQSVGRALDAHTIAVELGMAVVFVP